MYNVHCHVHNNLVIAAILRHMNPVHPLFPTRITLRPFLSSLPQMKLRIRFMSMHATCSTHFAIYDLIIHILPDKPAINILFFLILATASQSCFGFPRLDGIICLSFLRALTTVLVCISPECDNQCVT